LVAKLHINAVEILQISVILKLKLFYLYIDNHIIFFPRAPSGLRLRVLEGGMFPLISNEKNCFELFFFAEQFPRPQGVPGNGLDRSARTGVSPGGRRAYRVIVGYADPNSPARPIVQLVEENKSN